MKKYTHKFNCEFQAKDYDKDTHRLLHPIYCKHSINPEMKGKITCKYLGRSIEIILQLAPIEKLAAMIFPEVSSLGKAKKAIVNLCDFSDGGQIK